MTSNQLPDGFSPASFAVNLEELDRKERARRRWHENGTISDTRWNGWRLQPSNYVLELFDRSGYYAYEIDLERCLDSAQTLDWIMQIGGKEFDVPDMAHVISGLVFALGDVLDPQAHMCSFGASSRLTQREVRALVRKYVKEFGKE